MMRSRTNPDESPESRLPADLAIEQDTILSAIAHDLESLDDLLTPRPDGVASDEQILGFLD